jgi:hypothetical protein
MEKGIFEYKRKSCQLVPVLQSRLLEKRPSYKNQNSPVIIRIGRLLCHHVRRQFMKQDIWIYCFIPVFLAQFG